MDSTRLDALSRTEAHLAMLTRGREHHTLKDWQRRCPELADAELGAPSQLKGWLRRLPTYRADRILRHLVQAAQQGDSAALLAVIVCLAPGIRTLAARTGISCNEAVSEIALGILDYPVARRSSISAGLLLDARNRLHRSAQRRARLTPLEDTAVTFTDDREPVPPAQRVVQLVCQAHRQGVLNRTDTELILHTRIAGHQIKPIAHQLGLSATAAYQRRSRAEARLAESVAYERAPNGAVGGSSVLAALSSR